MTELSVPNLDRDAIYQSFIREAEQDTEQVLRVSNLATEVQALRAKLLDAFDELVDVHREISRRPHLKAKLAELGLPDPATLGIEALRGKQRPTKRARPAAKKAKPAAPASNGSGDAAPVVEPV
ncbi:hypothetical protein VXE65_19135 [Mycolicibacterium conceptionense]|uniref:hypothetical protein n=1 Tax=Mycolicibacterium conceptionense TaxID=451644 RepID=UPI003204F66D